MYFLLTSKRNRKILPTNKFAEAFDFITENQDTKVRSMDYHGKTKIMDKRVFLKNYYISTGDRTKFFQLVEIMVVGNQNLYDFLNRMELRQEYKVYKRDMKLMMI